MFFFFNDTATTEIYTLSLHDALPIYTIYCVPLVSRNVALGTLNLYYPAGQEPGEDERVFLKAVADQTAVDRKSTRLNSSHANISYAVFCLKKKIERQTVNKKRLT